MNIVSFLMIIIVAVSTPQMYAMNALQKKQDEIAKKQLEMVQMQEITHKLSIPRLIILIMVR